MSTGVGKEYRQSRSSMYNDVTSGPASLVVEPDSEIRKLLKDRKTSNLRKYIWLTVGEASFYRLVYFEILSFLFSGMRGALGLYLRQKMFSGLFDRCGKGVIIGRNVTIRHPHRIAIGENVVIDDNVVLDAKGSEAGTTIRIEDHAIIGRNSMLICKGGTIEINRDVNISVNCTLISESCLSIGEKTLVGGHCYVIAGGNHGTHFSDVPFVDQPRSQKGGVEIRKNCWIGANATVLDGTTIGPDAVVGAAALVNRSVPPQCVVAGVPAEPILDEGGCSVRRAAR